MGTRNLTAVMINGEYKIAQYGQWDGYLSGQGVKILDFISDSSNVEKLKEALSKVRFVDMDGKDKDFLEAYNSALLGQKDERTEEQRHWYRAYTSRDLGGEILRSVAFSLDDEILLTNCIGFAFNGLFCEYAYVIDFDKNTFEVYVGFQAQPLDSTERFYIEAPKHKYGVKLLKELDLFDLPSKEEFLKLESKEG